MWYVLLPTILAITLEIAHTNKEETELWACRGPGSSIATIEKKKEMLALITYMSLDYFRYYLLGQKFCLQIEHYSLQ